jgi:hypothetical protein
VLTDWFKQTLPVFFIFNCKLKKKNTIDRFAMFYIDWFQSSYTTEQPQKIGRETTVVETIECTTYVCG